MAHSAVGEQHITNKILECPRDKTTMQETEVGEACLDVCGKCGGQFFDAGEMFQAFGIKADPSRWDRDDTTASMVESKLDCPRCNHRMRQQDIKHESDKVEIDRCPGCSGMWLDKNEIDMIVKIGEKMAPVLAAEKTKAEAELAAMGDVDFNPGIIAKFLAMFKKKA